VNHPSKDFGMEFLHSIPIEKLPKFSVVIPSMNQAKFISQTLDSIYAQNYPNFEIFIADGGSSDETHQIVLPYQLSHPGQITFSALKDGSHSAGVKRGIEATNGEVIAWINSDDVYTSGAFWHVARFFMFNTSQYIVFGDNDYVDEKLNFMYEYPIKHSVKMSEFRSNLVDFCQVPQPSLFFRRTLLQYVQGPNSKIIDYEMWLRWSRDFQFNYIPHKLSLSRLHGNSITMNAEKKLLNGIIKTVYSEFHVISYSWVRKKHEVIARGNFSDKPISKSKIILIAIWSRFEWILLTLLTIPDQLANSCKKKIVMILKYAKK